MRFISNLPSTPGKIYSTFYPGKVLLQLLPREGLTPPSTSGRFYSPTLEGISLPSTTGGLTLPAECLRETVPNVRGICHMRVDLIIIGFQMQRITEVYMYNFYHAPVSYTHLTLPTNREV